MFDGFCYFRSLHCREKLSIQRMVSRRYHERFINFRSTSVFSVEKVNLLILCCSISTKQKNYIRLDFEWNPILLPIKKTWFWDECGCTDNRLHWRLTVCLKNMIASQIKTFLAVSWNRLESKRNNEISTTKIFIFHEESQKGTWNEKSRAFSMVWNLEKKTKRLFYCCMHVKVIRQKVGSFWPEISGKNYKFWLYWEVKSFESFSIEKPWRHFPLKKLAQISS